MEPTVQELPVSAIHPRDGFNPRRYFNPKSMQRLTDSIRAQGVIQAITVRPSPADDGQYELIAGHRRHRAATEAGLKKIPALIRPCDDRQALILATLENQERDDISAGEEALLARRVLDAFEGDKERAAGELGWSRSKLDARLLLLHADEAVLDAVASGAITLGHAELLAGLPAETQTGTLYKVIEDTISVAALKERLNGFAIPLEQAIFDRAGCAGCPHNSKTQGSLFGEHLDSARCQNRACFGEKTTAALESKKKALAEEFSAVHFDTERDSDTRRIVLREGAGAVGPDQFASGCANCQHFGCVIKTQLGTETCRVIRDVCFNPVCHSEKVAAYEKTQQEAPQSPEPKGNPTTAKTPAKSPAKKKTTAKANALTGKVTEHLQDLLIAHHRSVTCNDDAVWRAHALYGLFQLIGSEGQSKVRKLLKGVDAHAERPRILSAILVLSDEDRGKLQRALRGQVGSLTNLAGDAYGRGCAVKTALVLKAHTNTPWDQLFTLDRAFLEGLTKAGIEGVLKEAGFAKGYDKKNGSAAFAKLMKAKKDVILDRVFEADFSVEGFVPKLVESFKP